MKSIMSRLVVRFFALACFAWLAAALPVTAQVSLVSTGATWNFLDDGSNAGSAWSTNDFVDPGWAFGVAPLGYGDPWIVTTNSFGPDENAKFITTYYRTTFNVANPASITNLLLRIQRDDGPVVYLNGVEIFRDNLPAGPIAFDTTALAAIGGDDETALVPSNLSPSLLRTGENLLAVEMHQNAGNSSDLTFDLELRGNFTPVPPAVAIVVPEDNATVVGSNVTVVAAASDVDGTIVKVEFYQASVKIGEDTTPP
jgi:hypothetical protein